MSQKEKESQRGYLLRNRSDSSHNSPKQQGQPAGTNSSCSSTIKKRKKSTKKSVPSPTNLQPSMIDFVNMEHPKSKKKLNFNCDTKDAGTATTISINSEEVIATEPSSTSSLLATSTGHNISPSNNSIQNLEGEALNSIHHTQMESTNHDNAIATYSHAPVNIGNLNGKAITPSQQHVSNATITIDERVFKVNNAAQQMLSNNQSILNATNNTNNGADGAAVYLRDGSNLTASNLLTTNTLDTPGQTPRKSASNTQRPMENATIEAKRGFIPTPVQIDVQTVYQMFLDLTNKIDTMQNTLTSLNNTKDILTQQIRGLQHDTECNEDKISEMDIAQRRVDDKVDILSNTTSTLEQEVIHLRERIVKLETQSMKSNMVFSGISEKSDEDCIKVAQDFIKEELKITEDVPIKDAHRMGEGTNRALMVKFRHQDGRAKIYPYLQNLKGKRKYVNDQVPDETSERKRRERQVMAINKGLDDAHKLRNLKFKKGKLHVGDNPYKPKIVPITRKDILSLSPGDIQQIQELPMVKTREISEKHSRFKAYSCNISTLSDVQSAYLHIKIRHSDATHVMLAYRLNTVDPLDGEGWCDDGEHGAGAKMLRTLRDANKTQTAVFVVRYYGGIHLKKRRFEIIKELTESAIENLENHQGTTSRLQLRQLKKKPVTVRKNPAPIHHSPVGAASILMPPPLRMPPTPRGAPRGPQPAFTSYMQRQRMITPPVLLNNSFYPLTSNIASDVSSAEQTTADESREYTSDSTQPSDQEEWEDVQDGGWNTVEENK